MKTFIASLILIFSTQSFAQPRCEIIFSDEQNVISELANLYVDIENSKSSIMNTLKKDYKKKMTEAQRHGIDLSLLPQAIDEARKNQNQEVSQEKERQQKAQEQEEKMIPETFVRKTQFTSASDKKIDLVHFTGQGKFVILYHNLSSNRGPRGIYDASTGKYLGDLPSVLSIARAPEFGEYGVTQDGLVAFGPNEENSKMLLVNLKTGQTIRHFQRTSLSPTAFKVSPDERFVFGIGGGKMTVWDFQTGALLTDKKDVRATSYEPFNFSQDGSRIAFLHSGPLLRVLNSSTLDEVSQTQPLGRWHEFVIPNADGSEIIFEEDKALWNWNVAAAKISQVKLPAADVHKISFNHSFGLAYTYNKNMALIFNIAIGTKFAELDLGAEQISSGTIRGDGRQAAMITNSNKIEIWEASGKEK
jgi:hypothetical protein